MIVENSVDVRKMVDLEVVEEAEIEWVALRSACIQSQVELDNVVRIVRTVLR